MSGQGSGSEAAVNIKAVNWQYNDRNRHLAESTGSEIAGVVSRTVNRRQAKKGSDVDRTVNGVVNRVMAANWAVNETCTNG